MKNDTNVISSPRNRRSFLKTGLAAAGAVGTGLLARGTKAFFTPNTTNWEESGTAKRRGAAAIQLTPKN